MKTQTEEKKMKQQHNTSGAFDLTKKYLLQCVMDTLECDEHYGKEIIGALIDAGEDITEKTVKECDEYLQYDGRA